jgi:hypothetical protein
MLVGDGAGIPSIAIAVTIDEKDLTVYIELDSRETVYAYVTEYE